jgi:RNA methyltransferase, TrmH family
MALSKTKAKLLDRLRNPRQRSREGAFLVEGIRCAREFLKAKLPMEIRLGLVSPSLAGSPEGREVLASMADAPFQVEELPDRDLDAVSGVQHPQGVILVVLEPEGALDAIGGGAGTGILILDGIQDPGNAGTLIRAAHAFGLDGVLALEGTVDHWNPKVVRSSAGSLAHIPVARLPWSHAVLWLREHGISLFVADPGGEDVRGFRPAAPWALALGNEGGGPRGEVLGEARGVLAIPMVPGVDSLNAGMAGSILLFTLCGHRGGTAGGEKADGR